ncbi:MAG TPA: SIMPL domain-containing protein [Candidatus Dormibacteraeota bacterium]|nr:SIMPL domain-containing protein [Candidatus Dormibacteraeota bacterium]
MSAQNRFAVVIGVLIAVAASGITALAFSAKANSVQAPAVNSPPVSGVATSQAVAASVSATSNTITVVGSGFANTTPDQATIIVGASATRSSVRDAVNVATGDMNRLLAALHGQGVQDNDIQTSAMSIYQQNNCCPQGAITFQSSSQLTVTIHHLANTSAVIEAAVDAVGNDIQLGGVSPSKADTSAQVKTARSAAMSDANARAQEWARLASHHVGSILSLSEIVYVAPPNLCNGCGKGGAGMPIQPGESSVSVTITVVYELLA